MKLSSAGLLLLLTAAAMTLFSDTRPTRSADASAIAFVHIPGM
ncbi:hypothetical protein [Roseibium sp.]